MFVGDGDMHESRVAIAPENWGHRSNDEKPPFDTFEDLRLKPEDLKRSLHCMGITVVHVFSMGLILTLTCLMESNEKVAVFHMLTQKLPIFICILWLHQTSWWNIQIARHQSFVWRAVTTRARIHQKELIHIQGVITNGREQHGTPSF